MLSALLRIRAKRSQNLVLAQPRHKSTNTCDARSPHSGSPSSSLTGIAFAFFPFILVAFIPSSHRNREKGELGKGPGLVDRGDRRKRTCWKHGWGSNSPVLMPIHVLMWTFMDIMPHWWGAPCLHKQDVSVWEGGELWPAGYLDSCLCGSPCTVNRLGDGYHAWEPSSLFYNVLVPAV